MCEPIGKTRTDREGGFYGKLNAYGRATLSTEKIAYGGTDRKHRLLRSLAAGYMTKGHMGPTGKFKSQISGNLCRVHKIGISNLFILTVDFFENSGFIDHCRPDKQVFGSLFEKNSLFNRRVRTFIPNDFFKIALSL